MRKLFVANFSIGMALVGILGIADYDISLDTFGQFSIGQIM